jgi:hypothetical protein
MGVLFLGLQGLVTTSDVYRFLTFVPALIFGQWFGARSFKGADETVVRRWALWVLAVVTALRRAEHAVAQIDMNRAPAPSPTLGIAFPAWLVAESSTAVPDYPPIHEILPDCVNHVSNKMLSSELITLLTPNSVL